MNSSSVWPTGIARDRLLGFFALRGRDNLRRQIGRQDQVFVAQGASALDRVLQFAHIAGVIVVAKNVDRLRDRSSSARPPAALRLLLQKVIHQQRNVFEPLAQRRDLDRDDREPVIKILAERCRPSSSPWRTSLVAPTTRTLTGDALVVADAADFALLQDAQQFRLQRRRHRVHFIEKNRAEVRLLRTARACPRRRR